MVLVAIVIYATYLQLKTKKEGLSGEVSLKNDLDEAVRMINYIKSCILSTCLFNIL